MSKFLLLADGHLSFKLSPVEIEAILRGFGRIFGDDSELTRRLARYFNERSLGHINDALDRALSCGPYEGLISIGDNAYDWDNLGLDREDKISEAKELKGHLLDHFDLVGKNHIWVPGNHDLGYLNCSLAQLGPSIPPQSNLSCFQNIYGPIFGEKKLSDSFSIVWLSTTHIEILIARRSKMRHEELNNLLSLEQKELEFLEETLQNLPGRFFFAIHDPGSFLSPALTKILDRHSSKLAGSFTGHLHADWLLQLMKIGKPKLQPALKKYKVHFIPSVWGIVLPLLFHATGAGWAELNLDGDRAELLRYRLKGKGAEKLIL